MLHPATLWRHFGPIHLTLEAPKGMACKASAPVSHTGTKQIAAGHWGDIDEDGRPAKINYDVYQATLSEPDQKRSELFVGIDKAAWDGKFSPLHPKPTAQPRPKPQAQPQPQAPPLIPVPNS